MKEYLKYLIKKRFPIYLSLAITFTALFVIFNGKSFILQKYYDYYTDSVTYYISTNFLGIYAVPLATVLTIVPIFEFGFKMHRISAEQAYSLPIKRQELYLSRFIIGFLEVIVPFTVAYLVSLIPLLTWAIEYIDFLGMLIYLGMLIVVGLLFYSIIVFFASQANNTIDAILTVAFIICVGACFMALIYTFIPNVRNTSAYIEYFQNESYYILYSPFSQSITIGAHFALHKNTYLVSIPLLYFALLGILSFIGQIYMSYRFKSEDAGQKSESYFCYKVMVPILSLGLTATLCVSVYMIYVGVIIIALTYFLFVAHRRSFKFNALTWALFGSTAFLDLLLIAIFAR